MSEIDLKSKKVDEAKYKAIFSRFDLEGTFVAAELLSVGHIHDTYIVRYQNGQGVKRVVVQKINLHVFPNPNAISHNVALVSNHLISKVRQTGGDTSREVLQIIPTLDGESLLQLRKDEVWRCFHYIENTRVIDEVPTLADVQAVAQGFGRFQLQLSDFDSEQLQDAIPNFHNTPLRFASLKKSIEQDSVGRLSDVSEEISFILERADQLNTIVDQLAVGRLPLRVTHNDTKLNNVLLDKDEGHAVCVVDLDTLMKGSLLYDFGDGVRSCAKTAAEDAPDVSLMKFDLNVFTAFSAGFLPEVRSILGKEEAILFPYSAWLMTLESGIRFLSDYLVGDVYFKTKYSDHNLDRTRTQLKLVAEMEAVDGEMREIVAKFLA